MIATTEGETMKDRIDKYIKKKKREAALKIIKDNLPAILCVLGVILALIVGFAFGFAKNFLLTDTVKPQDFSVAGMTITLTNQFEEQHYGGFTQCYESDAVAILTLKEEFSLMEGLEDYTVEDYGRLVLASNSMDEELLKQENGIWYFAYTAEGGDGDTYYYCATLHKSGDAFWMIQFATPVSNESKLHDQFIDWAAGVTFE